MDSDGDGLYDYEEIAAGTNPYANPALNPPGTNVNAANPTGLTWKPFWKRNLPQVTIEQKWRRADIAILEDSHPTNGTHTMARTGSVQNHAMAAPRTTGLNTPVPLRDQVRQNPRSEILRAWSTGPAVPLEPSGTSPEWHPWTPEANQPLYARYRCQQSSGGIVFFPNADWVWQLNGDERIFRIVCGNPAPEPLTRHFLQIKRYRHWLDSEPMPDWTYDPTTVLTLTIPQGSTTSGNAVGTSLLFPSYPEKNPSQTVFYVGKTTEIEEICLPIEIRSPTRQASGTMLGITSSGQRQQIYAPELRIAKLFPGKDDSDVTYSPIQAAAPHDIVPAEDPDSYTIRVHDLSGVWQPMANPTTKPGIRVTTSTLPPYESFHSDKSSNPALYQVDATHPTMAPGWLETKPMILVSNLRDNERLMNGATGGARNDTSRIVLPGGTVTVAFPGWQRSTMPIPPNKTGSFTLPVPIAAKATLDMKMFQDADEQSPGDSAQLFETQLRGINEHFAQVGIVFDKTPATPSIGLPPGLNSQIPTFYSTNLRPSPLIKQVRELAVAAGRVTANGVEPNLIYTRTDARLGILYCASQPAGPFAPTPGQALLPMALQVSDQALSGNFFHLYTTNAGEMSGYNQRVAAHEVGHLLTNKGHFGGAASSPINYQSMAGSDQRGYNLMTEGPWPSVDWPHTHQRLSEEQEAFIFTQGAVWLRNP